MKLAAPWRRAAFLVAGLVAFAAIAAGALHYAVRALHADIVEALGPDGEIGAVRLGFGHVEIESLRVRAPPGWPSPDLLRARRVVVEPEFASLFSRVVRVARVTIDDGYLSALRSPDGRVRVLPGLGDARGAAGASTEVAHDVAGAGARPAARPVAQGGVRIARLRMTNGTLDFFDARVQRPALRIRAERMAIAIDDIEWPALTARSTMRISGWIKGAPAAAVTRDGRVEIDGWMVFANRDSELTSRLRGVDLVALQPYLIKTSETGVRRGLLDLDLDARVRDRRIDAPGVLTLTGLELAPSSSGAGTFMGLPRQAVIALMKDRSDRITARFTLRGSLDDPRFSISDDLALRFAAELARELGVSLEGIVRGIGGTGTGSGEAAGDAAKALGSVIRGILGK